ncbi:hypothetical protein [Shewanella maritima]|uniref:hypothetical protein n=1 Tax=Shewanella maritima TaxID=2520507 RepID=UPI001F5E3FB3|nr:hypothetical protein [Shewanella maritima]
MSVFGGLVYADDVLVSELEQQKRPIMEKFVRDRAMANFDSHYQRYDNFRSELQQAYTDYLAGSAEYNDALATSPQRADEYWLDTQNQVKQGWQQYQQGEAAYEARVEARAQKIAPQIYAYFEQRSKCADMKKGSRRDNCFERIQTRYDREFEKNSMPYIEPNEWLIREEISTSENVTNSIVTGVMTLGLFTAMQAIDAATGGDAGIRDHRMVYTNDVNHYKNILLVKMEGDFIKESGGYPREINDIHRFRHHKLTSDKVRTRLKQKGLHLADSWQMANRSEFDNAVASKVKQEADTRWRNEMRNKGYNIPPNLSWQAFQQHQQTQQRIQAEMGDMYVSPTLADWNNKQFLNRVVEPNIQRNTTELLRVLEAQKAEFADGGAFEASGKSALRATIIPPISMSLSLALVLLTVLKLPIKAWELIKAAKHNPAEPRTKHSKQKLINVGISATLLASIFVVPMSFSSNQFTLEDSATNYFFRQMEANDSASISYALRWLLTTQPLVQPIGDALDSSLQISRGFDAISGPIHHLDEAMQGFSANSSKAHQPTQETTALLPLSIITNADNARIAVMNIKPKYSPQMQLPQGAYDIKVTAPGYTPERQWVNLTAESTEFTINLHRQ